MLTVGQTLDLTISDLAFGGDGVARTEEGTVVFVPFAAVGDRLRLELAQTHARYARGVIRAILEAGPGRVEPRLDQVEHLRPLGKKHDLAARFGGELPDQLFEFFQLADHRGGGRLAEAVFVAIHMQQHVGFGELPFARQHLGVRKQVRLAQHRPF